MYWRTNCAVSPTGQYIVGGGSWCQRGTMVSLGFSVQLMPAASSTVNCGRNSLRMGAVIASVSSTSKLAPLWMRSGIRRYASSFKPLSSSAAIGRPSLASGGSARCKKLSVRSITVGLSTNNAAATTSSAPAGRCALAFAVMDAAESIMSFGAACRSQMMESASKLRTEMAVAAMRRGVLPKNMRTLCAPAGTARRASPSGAAARSATGWPSTSACQPAK